MGNPVRQFCYFETEETETKNDLQEEETKEGMLSSRPIRRSIIQLQQQQSIRMRTFLRKSTPTVS